LTSRSIHFWCTPIDVNSHFSSDRSTQPQQPGLKESHNNPKLLNISVRTDTPKSHGFDLIIIHIWIYFNNIYTYIYININTF